MLLDERSQNDEYRVCLVCGGKLLPTLVRISPQAQVFAQPVIAFNRRGRLRTYCSNACRQRAKRQRAGNEHSVRKHREPFRDNGVLLKPLIHQPGDPRAYEDWTLEEKHRYGPGNRRVQWELQKGQRWQNYCRIYKRHRLARKSGTEIHREESFL
jgi:hypothetical protein